MDRLPVDWRQTDKIKGDTKGYRCGYCGYEVASDLGWNTAIPPTFVRICPKCNRPTFFDGDEQVPGPTMGAVVEHLPTEVGKLYAEARAALTARAPTVAVLGFRKLLMHIAVEKGASQGDTFQNYVTFLDAQHLVPVGAKEWVDHIRKRGNDANHEIRLMDNIEGQELLVFSEMLLRLVYEFPNKLPKPRP